MRGRAITLGIALALVMLALRGVAQDGTVPLADAVKVEPGKCIEAAPLVLRIGTWLKRPTIDVRLRVEVRASQTANDVHFTILRDDKIVGEKDMRAEMTCAEFQSAVALAIASALDAIILQVEREVAAAEELDAKTPEPIADAAPDVLPIEPRDAGTDVTFVPPPPESSRLLVSLESGLTATHLPVATVLVMPGIDVRILPWLDARAAFGFTPEVSSVFGTTGRLVTQLVIGEVQACLVWRGLPVLPRGCAGIAFGAIPAHSVGFAVSQSNLARWGALAFRVDARWPVEGLLGVMVSFSVDPVLGAPTFALQESNPNPQLQTPAVGFSLLGGMQLRVF